jgi:hypothetical protein
LKLGGARAEEKVLLVIVPPAFAVLGVSRVEYEWTHQEDGCSEEANAEDGTDDYASDGAVGEAAGGARVV